MVTDPREHVNAITLRSGTILEQPQIEREEENEEEMKTQEIAPTPLKEGPTKEDLPKWKRAEEQKEAEVLRVPSPYDPPIPFPRRLKKQIRINVLAQMPKYAKFMKEILSNKRKLGEGEIVMLTDECSAIIQKKLLSKLKDPGSFTLPCTIGDFYFDKVLCDLGASINLMSLSVFRKLGIGEVKPTMMSLQLADRSIKLAPKRNCGRCLRESR